MSDVLDEKLEQALSRYSIMENGLPARGDLRMTEERLIDDVKQAFIDAGWFTPADKELVQEIVNNRAQQKIDQHWIGPDSITTFGPLQPPDTEYDAPSEERYGPVLMTGQEWFDRFEKELGDDAKHCTSIDFKCTCDLLEAARRAAGLSKGE